MRDRANVAIVQDTKENSALVYLYTHWGGYDLPFRVQAALAKKWRWNDGTYLARIIFDQMTADCHGEETGYGIATYRPDNERPIIVVNPETQRVGFAVEDSEPNCYKDWTFSEYIGLNKWQIESAYDHHPRE